MNSSKPSDISYIIAAEFELTKGTVVSGRFPPTFDLSLENILIEKLIPDGLHNYQSDCFCFRNMVPLNATSLANRIQRLNAGGLRFRMNYFNDRNLQFDLDLENPNNEFFDLFPDTESASFESGVRIGPSFDLEFDGSSESSPASISLFPPLEVVMNFDSKILLSSDSHNFLISPLDESDTESSAWFFREMMLFADPTSKKILRALSEDRKTEERLYIDMNFFTIVANKKQKSAQRGAVYRSITICTETLRDLSPLRPYLEEIIEQYMELPPNDPQIQGILENAYQDRPKLTPGQRILKSPSFYRGGFLKSNPGTVSIDSNSQRT